MNTNTKKPILVAVMVLVVLSLVLSACATPPTPAPVPTQDVGMIQTQAAQTVVADAALKAPPTATCDHCPVRPNPQPQPACGGRPHCRPQRPFCGGQL